MREIKLRLPDDLIDSIDICATAKHQSRSEFLRDLIIYGTSQLTTLPQANLRTMQYLALELHKQLNYCLNRQHAEIAAAICINTLSTTPQ